MRKKTVSFLLLSIINEACRMACDTEDTALQAKVQEVKSIFVSVLYKKNFTIHKVVRAGMWELQTMFT